MPYMVHQEPAPLDCGRALLQSLIGDAGRLTAVHRVLCEGLKIQLFQEHVAFGDLIQAGILVTP